jgi:hypothetical protein
MEVLLHKILIIINIKLINKKGVNIYKRTLYNRIKLKKQFTIK